MDELTHNSIEAALVAAQANVTAVKKDGKNTFAGWKYATADELIAESKKNFKTAGLAFDRKSDKLVYLEGNPLIESVFNLTHGATKEVTEYTSSWPVIEKKGTPLDKAYAAGLTSSLAYKIRDVLLIPKTNEDDSMDRRDDTQYEPKPKQKWKQEKKQETIKQGPKWPELLEKYRPLLPLVNMSESQFGNLTLDEYMTTRAKISDLQKTQELTREG